MKIKHKEQILKAAREKQQTYKWIPVRLTANLSIETLQDSKEGQEILKVMKEKNLQIFQITVSSKDLIQI